MDKKKILVADDEERIVKLVSDFLKIGGYEVLPASDGAQALELFNKNPDIALAIIDIMMPELDGWALTKEIRKTSDLPIIMLSARAEEFDLLTGFESGIDEYVTKPFSVPELMARVKTNLRRAPELLPQKELVFEDIRMDLAEKKVFRGDKYIHLGPTEFRLLRMLMETPGKVFSREFLLKNVWGNNIYVESRTVDVHIRRLRKSLNEFGPDYIRTVRATGYAIDNSLGEEDADGEK